MGYTAATPYGLFCTFDTFAGDYRSRTMQMSDSDLILFRRISEGDLPAFETLFRKYYSFLCALAYRKLQDHDTAEEIVQELFYRIWEKKNDIRITSAVKAYLARAVYYNSINALKLRRKDISVDEHMISEMVHDERADDLLHLSELDDLIVRCLEELPEKGRRIFRLSRFEGLTYREIAERLSVSVKTVEAYMGQALRIFRKNLKQYQEG